MLPRQLFHHFFYPDLLVAFVLQHLLPLGLLLLGQLQVLVARL
jgi:hypothetical protein